MMGKYVADIHLTAIKMYGGDEPVCIASDVEHNQVTHFVGSWERGTKFVKTFTVGFLQGFEPTGK